MTLEDIATRLCNVLSKAVLPALQVEPAPDVITPDIDWREVQCKLTPDDIENAIQALATDARQKNIVQFLEMSMRKHMLVDSIIGANPARNVAVRVSLERWPVKLYVLEYMARCQNPSRT
jgi:hypothetical protein